MKDAYLKSCPAKALDENEPSQIKKRCNYLGCACALRESFSCSAAQLQKVMLAQPHVGQDYVLVRDVPNLLR